MTLDKPITTSIICQLLIGSVSRGTNKITLVEYVTVTVAIPR